MSIVPYKSNEIKIDLSDTTTKFYEIKRRLYQDFSAYLEEDLQELTIYIEDIRKGLIKDPKELTSFLNGELVEIMKIIMNKTFRFTSELRTPARIQPFIYKVVVFCLEMLNLNYPGIFDILEMLLNNNLNYYSYQSFYGPKDVVAELYKKYPLTFTICPLAKSLADDDLMLREDDSSKIKDQNSLAAKVVQSLRFPNKDFVKSSCIYQKITILYLINVNFFIQIGGVEVLSAYTRSVKTVNCILATVEIFNQLQNCLEEDYYTKEVLPNVLEMLKTLPTQLNDEEIKSAKKEEIAKLIKLLHSSIKGNFEKTQLTEILCNYELEILSICLKSQYMEKRIYAITTLVEKIAEAERNQEDFEKLKNANPSATKPANWFTTENYIAWLEKNEIAGILLGESSHSELLRRSSALFRFLFRNKRLSMEKIDSICKLALEKHDTHRKYILKILSDLAELMNPAELEELFQKIKEMGAQEIDQDILQLIKTIGNNITIRHHQSSSGGNQPTGAAGGSGAGLLAASSTTRKKRKYHEDHDRPPSFGRIKDQDNESIYNLIKDETEMRTAMHEEQIEDDDHNGKRRKGWQKGDLEIEIEEKGEEVLDEQGRSLGRNILDYLWDLIMNGSNTKGATPQIITNATNIIKEILSGKLGVERIHFVEKAIVAISKNKLVNESIEILQNILKSQYPVMKKDGGVLANKREFVQFLDSEFSLTHVLFNSLIQLKSDMINLIENQGNGIVITNEIEDIGPLQEANDDEIKPEVSKDIGSTDVSSIEDLKSYDIQTRKEMGNAPAAGYSSDIINNYVKDFESRLRFIRLLKTSSYEQLEFKHANLLWNLLVENALSEKERECFFGFFTGVIYTASNEFNILNEDIINYLFSDILLNIQYSSYSIPIYHCFEAFFIYLNKRYELLKPDGHNFKVHSLDLIGIESLWELYLNAVDPKVNEKAQEFLLKLASKLADKVQRAYFVNVAIKHIEKAYAGIKENEHSSKSEELVQRISHCLDFIVKLLEEFGEFHATRGHSASEAVVVTINNSTSNAMNPKKFPLTLFKTMTVGEARALIASKLNPPLNPNELMLMTRGSVIQGDSQLLEELKLVPEQTFLCTKQSIEDLEMQPIPLIGPKLPEENSAEVMEKIANLQSFLPDFEVDFLKYVLKKKNYDLDDAATTLLDPDMAHTLRVSMEEEERKAHKAATPLKEKPKEGEVRLSQAISNNAQNFEMLFKLLSLEIHELDGKIWNLLMNLPMNTEIYDNLKNIFVGKNDLIKDEIIFQEVDWSQTLDPQNMPKLLYSLQIITNLVSCGVLDEKDSDLYEKSEWRINFLEQFGFDYLFNLFLDFPVQSLTKQGKLQERTHNTEAKVLQIILTILKIYTNSTLISSVPDQRQKLILEALGFSETKNPALFNPPAIDQPPSRSVSGHGVSDNNSASGMTPTFVSPENSKSPSPHSTTPTHAQKEKDDDDVSLGVGAGSAVKAPKETFQVDEFLELVKIMKDKNRKLSSRILDSFNFEKFINKVLEVIQTSLDASDKDKDLSSVTESCIEFMIPCFVAHPDLLDILYQHKAIPYIFKNIFMVCQQQNIRTPLTRMITFLSKHSQYLVNNQMEEKELPERFFLKTLLPYVFALNIEDQINEDYFLILSQLFKMVPYEIITSITDIGRLFAFSIRFIKERPILEERSSDTGDKVLGGFLLLAQTLVEIEPGLKRFFENKANEALEEFSLHNYDLIKELYDYLFYLPKEDEKIDPSLNLPKCKYKITRAHAFKLLYLFSKGWDPNLYETVDLLAWNHQKLPSFTLESPAASSSTTNTELKNVTGYVGLKNLGCTCYMNSLIQQLFMTIPFRKTILNSEVKIKLAEDQEVFLSQLTREQWENNQGTIKSQLDDNVLYQLQLLLANLEESVSQYIVPQDFFNSIKTINGEKIIATVQQDVNEFFNTLCDKVETCLKSTPQQTVLEELIGGILSHEIISLETDYPYYTEREEAYLTIPLDIKNRRDLSEALDLYIKEDILEGDNKYFCEKYDRKIRVMKRCCIKTLPNTLLITLKRFDFDFTSMQKVKINDFFEFPMSINLKPWTKVGLKDQIPPEANYEPPNLDDSYYEYELVGVLVHSGTADGGHYYSFIKDRADPTKGWFEFNDNRVKPFNIKELKNECFGGDGGNSKDLFDFDFTKSRNAYILFYERPNPQKTDSYVKYIDKEVPVTLSESLWRDNLELLRSRYFYDVDYFKFTMDILKLAEFPMVDHVPSSFSEPDDIEQLRAGHRKAEKYIQASEKFEQTGEVQQGDIEIEEEVATIQDEDPKRRWAREFKIIKLIVTLACEIFVKNRDGEQFAAWMKLLKEIFENFAPGAVWFIKFLNNNPEMMKLMYGENVSSMVKEALKDLLTKTIDRVYKIEAPYFLKQDEYKVLNQYKIETKTVQRACLARFLKTFSQSFIHEKNRDLSKPLDYFRMVIHLIQMSSVIAHFMIHEGLLTEYFDLYMHIQKTSNSSFIISSSKDKEKYHAANITMIFQICELLIRSCITDKMCLTKTVPASYLFGNNNIDIEAIPIVPRKIIETVIDLDNFRKHFLSMQEKCDSFLHIARHIAWEDKEASKKMIFQIVSHCCSIVVNYKGAEEDWKILYNLAKLEDSYQEIRIEWMFSDQPCKAHHCSRGDDLMSGTKKSKDSYDKATAILSLKWLAQMVADIEPIRYYILDNIHKFEWIPAFLEENIAHSAKSSIILLAESELNARLPIYMRKSLEILSLVLPYKPKQKVENTRSEPIEEEIEDPN